VAEESSRPVNEAAGPPAPPASTANAGDHDRAATVTASVVTVTDHSRSTPATPGATGRAGRELVTHLYEPAGAGPFPLILFGHGLDGHPRKFTRLHRAWAAAGYVVAAPTFPVSNDRAPGGADFTDLAQQPGDLGFVLDTLLGPASPLQVPVDPGRIGAGGLSLGGATVYAFVYDDCCRDERVTAAMVLDGNELGFSPDLSAGPPLLLVHADLDPSLPYTNTAGHFAAARVPTGFLTLHLAAHAEPFEDTVSPADRLVETVTIAWWDRWLGDDAGAPGAASVNPLDRVVLAVHAVDPLATWQSRVG
jgi:dienelactone hydrolase